MPAYALRAEYEDTFAGGLLSGPNGDINVSEELEDGDGTIVVDDSNQPLIDLFDAYPALKRVKAPEPVTAEQGYETYAADDLRREAKGRGLEVTSKTTKADLVAALDNSDSQRKEA